MRARGELKFKKIVEVKTRGDLVESVVENRGVGFSPASFCEIERRLGEIVTARVGGVSLRIPFFLVYTKRGVLSDTAVAFANYCREMLPGYQSSLLPA